MKDAQDALKIARYQPVGSAFFDRETFQRVGCQHVRIGHVAMGIGDGLALILPQSGGGWPAIGQLQLGIIAIGHEHPGRTRLTISGFPETPDSREVRRAKGLGRCRDSKRPGGYHGQSVHDRAPFILRAIPRQAG